MTDTTIGAEPRMTEEEAKNFYQARISEVVQVQNDMKRINVLIPALRKGVAGNKFLEHNLNVVLDYQQKLIGLAINYYELLEAAMETILKDETDAK